jgi:hypothetical protein
VAAWLAGQRSSAVVGDGEARRAEVLVRRRGQRRREGTEEAEVLVRQRGSGDGKHGGGGGAHAAAWQRRRARTAGRGVFGQRRADTGRSAGRTRGVFMARRDSSAAPSSQSGCGARRLGH